MNARALASLLDDYRVLTAGLDGWTDRPFEVVRRHVKTMTSSDPLEVDAAIAELGDVVGWAIRWGYESCVWCAIEPDLPPVVDTTLGSGEFSTPDGLTLTVTDLTGSWRLVWSSEQPFEDGDGAVTDGLAEVRTVRVDPRHIGGRSGVSLVYEQIWADAPVTGFGPVLRRFVGFDAGGIRTDEGGDV